MARRTTIEEWGSLDPAEKLEEERERVRSGPGSSNTENPQSDVPVEPDRRSTLDADALEELGESLELTPDQIRQLRRAADRAQASTPLIRPPRERTPKETS